MKSTLASWKTLNTALPRLTEDELLDLLEQEKKGKHRADVLVRLHQRYCVVRMSRERVELLK